MTKTFVTWQIAWNSQEKLKDYKDHLFHMNKERKKIRCMQNWIMLHLVKGSPEVQFSFPLAY